MSKKALKILIGLNVLFLLAIIGVLLWTKSPDQDPMEAWKKEIEIQKTEKPQRQISTLYIEKDGYQLLPGEFDDSRQPEELMAITDLKAELTTYLKEGNKHVVFFKASPESGYNDFIDLLDVLSAIEKLQYTIADISQAEIDFLKLAHKKEAQ